MPPALILGLFSSFFFFALFLSPTPADYELVGKTFRIQPDADRLLVALDRHEFGVALRGKLADRCENVEFVIGPGKHGLRYLHGNTDFYLLLFPVVLIVDVNKKVASLLCDADVGVGVLNGDELSVFGSADGVKKSADITSLDWEAVAILFCRERDHRSVTTARTFQPVSSGTLRGRFRF